MRSSRALALVACVLAIGASACTSPDVAKRQYLESGNKFFAQQKYGEAIVQYRNALRKDARLGEARRKLAEAYARSNNPQAAMREYVRAADLLPNDIELQLYAGNYLLTAGQYEDAKARADKALNLDSRNTEALVLRATALAGLKDVSSAVKEIEDALKVQQNDGRMYTNLGMLQLMQGKRDEAEAAFKKAIEVSPESVNARLAYANFYLAAGRLAEGEAVLKQALGLDPRNTMANRLLAAVYLVTKRAPEAEEPLKMAAASKESSSLFTLADYYIGMKRTDDASAILKTLAAQPATYGAAMMRLAQTQYAAGRQDEARKMLDELISKQPRNAQALSLRAGWQLASRDVDNALASARAAVEADGTSADAQFALGRAYLAKGRNDDAAAAMTEVLRLNPRVLPAKLLLSKLKLVQGEVTAAVQVAQDAKAQAPTNPEVRFALARSLLAQRNVAGAESEVQALLSEYPNNAATHSIHGMVLLGKRDSAGARAAFERSLQLNPIWPDALVGLLALDAQSKTLPAAVNRIETALRKEPKNASLLVIAARTYIASKKTDKAADALRQSIDAAPENLNAYLLLGNLYMSEHKLDEALAQFDAAAARQPNQIGAQTMAALIAQLQNKKPEAQKRYEAIVATNQRAPIATNNLAWLYAENDQNLDVALQLAQTAKSQLPRVAEVNDTLGWIYVKKDLASLAIPPLEQSVATDPTNAIYHVHLGVAYAKAGQAVKARAALEQGLKLNPSASDARMARQTLEALTARPNGT